MRTTRLLLCTLLGAAGLAACGGGDSTADVTPPPPLTEVPVSAAASPGAYTTFALQQAADDTAEPLSLDTFAMAPASESDDPVVLD
jgi:hypothetical protein